MNSLMNNFASAIKGAMANSRQSLAQNMSSLSKPEEVTGKHVVEENDRWCSVSYCTFETFKLEIINPRRFFTQIEMQKVHSKVLSICNLM